VIAKAWAYGEPIGRIGQNQMDKETPFRTLFDVGLLSIIIPVYNGKDCWVQVIVVFMANVQTWNCSGNSVLEGGHCFHVTLPYCPWLESKVDQYLSLIPI
jgi:hypothetical protein